MTDLSVRFTMFRIGAAAAVMAISGAMILLDQAGAPLVRIVTSI